MSIAYDPAPRPHGAEPSFPPLLRGARTPPGVDPFAKAVAAAGGPDGVEAGTVYWSDRDDVCDAAIVLAPETPLTESLAMVLVIANGLGDSLGALAPPEIAVTWRWPDRIYVNGGLCGVLRADAGGRELSEVPPWLVVGITLRISPAVDTEPGHDPGRTTLREEGCVDLSRTRLLESWSRHTLVWINRWLDDGFQPVHDAWVGRVESRGEAVDFDYGGARHRGVFLGLDEHGGMILKTPSETSVLGLDAMLNHPRAPAQIDGDAS